MANLSNINNKFLVTTGGDVGINTTSPTEKLSVNGNISLNRYLSLSNSDYTYILGKRTSPSDGFYLTRLMGYGDNTFYGSFDVLRHDANDGELRFRTRTADVITDVMTIVDGNVGIGTTSPSSSLEVAAANSQIRLTDTDDSKFVLYSYSGGKLIVRNNSVNTTENQYTLTQDGDFGIGTISPVYKLQVEDAAADIFYGATDATSGSMFRLRSNNKATTIFDINANGRIQVGSRTSGDSSIISQSADVQLRIGSTSNENNPFIRFQAGNGSGGTYADIQLDPVNQLLKFNDPGTNSGSIGTNPMVLDASGNVGISNSSPSGKLHIGSGSSLAISGSADELIVDGAGNSGISIGSGTAAVGSLFFADSGSSASGYVQYNHSSNALIMGTQATERMRIDSSGSIKYQTGSGKGYEFGASGSSASAANMFCPSGFTLAFGTNNTERMRIDSSGNSNFYGNITISKSTPFITLSNTAEDECGIVMLDSADAGQSAKITYDAGSSNSLKFYNNAANERMRITSVGNIQSNALGSGVVGYGFQLSPQPGYSQIYLESTTTSTVYIQRFYNPNGNIGNISLSGSSTTFSTSSDYRLKEDFKEFTGLDKVSNIPVYDFKWKNTKDRSYGVIAHELQEVLPEAVTGEKDGVFEDGEMDVQGVDYSRIVPLLIKSIQELKAENDSLKARIETLENN